MVFSLKANKKRILAVLAVSYTHLKQRTTRYAGGKQRVIPKKSPNEYNKDVQA